MRIRIGTRRSALALTQANAVMAALQSAYASDVEIEIVPILTSGDKRQGTPAAHVSDKKEWILEIEEALSEKRIDLAVHSSKDVPVDIQRETIVTSILPRDNPFDAFILKEGRFDTTKPGNFTALRAGAVVGTSSLRRRAQVLRLRPDIKVVSVRGNVPTRLEKLDTNEELDALVLAYCGMRRLNLAERAEGIFTAEELVPAANQGILAAQYRAADEVLGKLIQGLIDPPTQLAWLAERAFVARLDANCTSSLGTYAECVGEVLRLRARVLSPDGSKTVEGQTSIEKIDEILKENDRTSDSWKRPERAALALADDFLARGAGELLHSGCKDTSTVN